ncbi:uncharacterized protein F4807DRAFT_343208 [Annulohypoxylon truncatum]|uniref:uncharacterized protein n=1 Tax=Annulohypoxylon truncatum TaxID=327061 RepID=UPI00200723C4|nr:uncharacterized protein F4807DRAFT_343208 [Annulohypoxylon truncatum]KAI1212622.1 hypothetical protein F4807DRAFT_343208 [Annulohypoxylon truncatum]
MYERSMYIRIRGLLGAAWIICTLPPRAAAAAAAATAAVATLAVTWCNSRLANGEIFVCLGSSRHDLRKMGSSALRWIHTIVWSGQHSKHRCFEKLQHDQQLFNDDLHDDTSV